MKNKNKENQRWHNMKKLNQITKATLLMITMLTLFTACTNAPQTEGTPSYTQNEIFNETTSATVKEKIFKWGKGYTVETDNNQSLKMNGRGVFYLGGEQITLTNENDEVISTEKQHKRWGVKINRMASVRNANDEIIGFIGEKTTDHIRIAPKMTIFDYEGNQIGKIRGTWNLGPIMNLNIYNNDGSLAYEVTSRNIVQPTYNINVKDSSEIPFEYAVYTSLILNELRKSDD